VNVPLYSTMDVFLFIIFSSVYVCSILWIYGDVACRGGGKGMIIPLLFVLAGALALIKAYYLALLVWPIGFVIWFVMRPKEEIELIE